MDFRETVDTDPPRHFSDSQIELALMVFLALVMAAGAFFACLM